MSYRQGLDYAGARPPYPAWLPANGYTFVCRYLKILPNSYAITLSEYQGLRAAGVDVCLNWEQNETDFSGGATSGQSYAAQAKAQAQALGAWPCPIYFSKDTNTAPTSQDAAYLSACASVLGSSDLVGIYGSNQMCQWAASTGLARYTWANVWGVFWTGANLWQTKPNTQLSWGAVDVDQALTADFGQVGYAEPDPPPTPEESSMAYVDMAYDSENQQEHYVYLYPQTGGEAGLYYQGWDRKTSAKIGPVLLASNGLLAVAGVRMELMGFLLQVLAEFSNTSNGTGCKWFSQVPFGPSPTFTQGTL